MHRMTALFVATVATVFLTASPAGADIKHGGEWAFGASHYKDDVSTRENFNGKALPLQVVFRGGGDGNINSRTVNNLLDSAWPKWGRRSNPLCTGARYAPFPRRPPRRGEAWDKPAFFGSNNRACFSQTHGRFFSDRRHSEQFGHSDAGHFMVANFHRENVSPFHEINQPLHQTRRHVLRIAERGFGTHYCVDFNYGMHHMARTRYARTKSYDKVLGRVSFRNFEANRCR